MDLQASIERVRQKCERLRIRAPELQERAPRDHLYQLGEPLDEFDVHRFERYAGFKVPDEYALFLTEVGNGGAGPGSGLLKLDPNRTRDLLRGRQDAQHPFPYLGYQLRMYGRAAEGFSSYGNIPITEDDDESDGWFVLVINDRERGNVWKGQEIKWTTTMCPVFAKDGRPATFLIWYEEWLDSVLGP